MSHHTLILFKLLGHAAQHVLLLSLSLLLSPGSGRLRPVVGMNQYPLLLSIVTIRLTNLDERFVFAGLPSLFTQPLKLSQLILEPFKRYGCIRVVAAGSDPNTLFVAWHVAVV